MIDPGFERRVVLITGANNPQGIGAATARAFVGQGAPVFFTSFGEPSGDYMLEELRRAGGRVAAAEVDLADAAAIHGMFERAESELGPVDILVHNATYWEADTLLPAEEEGRGRPLASWPPAPKPVTRESHDRHFAVNSRASALMIAEYVRRYLARRARSGRIVAVTSDGTRGFPREISYGASKSALESYTHSAARELAHLGITANLVRPCATQTGWITPEVEAEVSRTVAFGRPATPEQVADAILFLASDQASFITGQRLALGGHPTR